MRARSPKTTRARHKKIIKSAKGFRYKRGNVYCLAKTAVQRAGRHAFSGRKLKKRNFRNLWIARLNAVCRNEGIKYSRFIEALTKANIVLNRKVMSELAINYEPVFKELLKKTK